MCVIQHHRHLPFFCLPRDTFTMPSSQLNESYVSVESLCHRLCYKQLCFRLFVRQPVKYFFLSIFNLQGCDGPTSGSFGVSRSLHRRHGTVRRFRIKWDIWPLSKEAAGVGRLFQRRGELENGVQGLVLHTLRGSPAPRGGARDGDISQGNPRVELRV